MGSQSQPMDLTDSRIVPVTPLLVSVFPPEVLDQITSYLTTPEYGNLRLTCKPIEAAVFDSFSKEFFTKRQFMLTEFSLQALVDISKSRFTSRLTHVILGLERPFLESPHAFGPGDRHDLDQKNNRIQHFANHITLINTSQDVEMLAEAFQNLEILDTIGIRDFYSRSRHRDYPQVEWKSYGIRSFQEETGLALFPPRTMFLTGSTPTDQSNYLSRLFINIFRALGKANKQPRNFETILRHNSFHDTAFYLPKYIESSINPVLGNLRKLFLDLNSELPFVHVESNNSASPCPNYFLRIFLSHLPQLEHLRLNFRLHDHQGAHDVLSWISKGLPADAPTNSTSYPQSPPSIHLEHLRQLDIGMASLEPGVLLAIFEKYKATLRVISLHKVSLRHDDGPAAARTNLWTKLFRQMSKIDIQLNAINLSYLSQENSGRRHIRHISFDDSKNPTSRAWGGTDIQSALRDFTSHLVVRRLNEDTDISSDSGSEASGGSDASGGDVLSDDD